MARSFNGTTDQVITGTFSDWSVDIYTFSGWFYLAGFPSGTNFGTILEDNGSTQSGMWVRSTGGSPAHVFHCEWKAGTGVANNGTTDLALNTWYHGAMTANISSNFMKGYLNGVNEISTTPNGGATPSGALAMGSDRFGDQLNGRLADLAIWGVNLTTTEISALAKGIRPHKIRPTSLMAWWPFDGLVSPEIDLIKANNGTLTGTGFAFGPPVMPITPRWPQSELPTPPAPPATQRMGSIISRVQRGSRWAA